MNNKQNILPEICISCAAVFVPDRATPHKCPASENIPTLTESLKNVLTQFYEATPNVPLLQNDPSSYFSQGIVPSYLPSNSDMQAPRNLPQQNESSSNLTDNKLSPFMPLNHLMQAILDVTSQHSNPSSSFHQGLRSSDAPDSAIQHAAAVPHDYYAGSGNTQEHSQNVTSTFAPTSTLNFSSSFFIDEYRPPGLEDIPVQDTTDESTKCSFCDFETQLDESTICPSISFAAGMTCHSMGPSDHPMPSLAPGALTSQDRTVALNTSPAPGISTSRGRTSRSSAFNADRNTLKHHGSMQTKKPASDGRQNVSTNTRASAIPSLLELPSTYPITAFSSRYGNIPPGAVGPVRSENTSKGKPRSGPRAGHRYSNPSANAAYHSSAAHTRLQVPSAAKSSSDGSAAAFLRRRMTHSQTTPTISSVHSSKPWRSYAEVAATPKKPN